ncbi:hypothetical protein [Paraburkholderia dipogonis]|jgi:uncharacterized protein|uniref:hypothetical protein n=1 Tax=Paraburkholderia dipogonis TaxID=1211383 RepID=UPI0038B936B7
MTALGSTGAWASDIQCATTRQPAERVICDHAILDNQYDDIVAQQQTLLSAGKLSSGQLAQWRQSRNACSDVHCIDTVFAQWKAMAKSAEANTAAVPAPVIASATALAPVGPASDADALASDAGALPASQASPTSEASLVRQGSAAGIALPQPVASQASSPTVASAASGANESHSGTGLAVGLIGLVVIAIASGAFVIRRKKSVRRS